MRQVNFHPFHKFPHEIAFCRDHHQNRRSKSKMNSKGNNKPGAHQNLLEQKAGGLGIGNLPQSPGEGVGVRGANMPGSTEGEGIGVKVGMGVKVGSGVGVGVDVGACTSRRNPGPVTKPR